VRVKLSNFRRIHDSRLDPDLTLKFKHKSNKRFKASCLCRAIQTHVDDIDLSEIRNAWQTDTPLGNDYFRQKVESKLGCKVEQSRRSRPKLKSNQSVDIL
jgi:hypothetical protein